MGKMILITECTKCPYLYFLNRHNSLCSLKNNEQIKGTAAIHHLVSIAQCSIKKRIDSKEVAITDTSSPKD